MIQANISPYSSILSSSGYCNICYNIYNLQENKPLLICANDHSICKKCLIAIRRSLRCPFCRARVQFDRIRLNKEAYNQALLKSNKQSPLSVGRSRNQSDPYANDRIRTEQTEQIRGGLEPLYLDQAQFEFPPSEIEERPRNGGSIDHCRIEKIMTIFVLVGMQLPVGVINLMLSITYPNQGCFDCLMPGSIMSLRDYWRIAGSIQIFFTFLSISLMVVECIYSHSLRVRGIVWVLLMLLMLMVEVNCILGLLISINLTTDPIINQYPQTIASLVVVNMLYNIVTLFMEILLIGKYPAYYFPS